MPDFSQVMHNPAVIFAFKWGILILLGLYSLFLLVILKQIRSMNTIITQPDLFPILQTALFILIAFNLFVFLLGLVIL